jgi:hypothetical protein
LISERRRKHCHGATTVAIHVPDLVPLSDHVGPILHRFTGIALSLGSILLAWWLVAVAAGGELFAATHSFIASPIGVLLLFGWSVAFYHLCSTSLGISAPASASTGSRTRSASIGVIPS